MIIRSLRFWPAVLLLFAAAPTIACSSFASYAGRPLYGMNFDYPTSSRVRFVLETHGDLRVFHLTFSRKGHFATTMGMNSAGLFIADQILDGEKPEATGLDGNGLFPWRLYHQALAECADAACVKDLLRDRRLVHDPFLGLHLLIADNGGEAFIAEVGVEGNELMEIEGDFIAMTNFSHAANRGRDPGEVSGAGAGRYRVLCEGLGEEDDILEVAEAFSLLSRAANRTDYSPTRCSLVLDPERGEIFIALEMDYERIWKVSISEGTIETYRGVEEERQWPLGDGGILATDLDTPAK